MKSKYKPGTRRYLIGLLLLCIGPAPYISKSLTLDEIWFDVLCVGVMIVGALPFYLGWKASGRSDLADL